MTTWTPLHYILIERPAPFRSSPLRDEFGSIWFPATEQEAHDEAKRLNDLGTGNTYKVVETLGGGKEIKWRSG